MPHLLFDSTTFADLPTATGAFQALFDGMPDAAVLADPDRRIVAVNPAAERLLGYHAADLIGQPTRILYADEAKYQELGEKRFHPLSTAGSGVDETRYRCRTGEIVTCETISSVVRDADGTVLGYLGIGRDVSRQRAVQNVRHRLYAISSDQTLDSAQKIQRILELGARHFDMPLGIVSHIEGQDYNVLYATAPNGEVQPGNIFDVAGTYCIHTLNAGGPTGFHHAGRSAIADHPCYAAFGLESYLGVPLKVDGERFGTLNYSDWRARKPFDADDYELIRLFAEWIGNELSRARTLEALQAARAEAERANAAKSRFLATISHDLRTPFTGLLGMFELLATSPLDAEQRGYLEHAHNSATALLDLVNDVLDLSKIEAGHMSFETVPFELPALANCVAELFRPTARDKQLELTVRIAEGCPHRVLGDATRVRQILTNLLSNAVKFTTAGSVSLTVEPDAQGDGIHFCVCDTGSGIARERHGAIFEPFEQAETSITRRFGGTGLGLAICKQLVEGMQGRISLASAPGAGSRFDVVLPLPAAGEAQAIAPAGAAPVELPPLSLLVAEDHPVSALLLQTVLERAGHTVTLVEDGARALAEARRKRFDAAIFDMQMPEVDGLEATRRIRAGEGRDPDLPIVALTADALAETRERYRDAGLSAFLTKPIDWQALNRTLAEVTQTDALPIVAAGRPDSPAGTADEAPLLDAGQAAQLRETAGGDKYVELLTRLIHALQEARAEVAALPDRPAADAQQTLHSLKGIAFGFGAKLLGQFCEEAEIEAEGGGLRDETAAEITEALDATLAELRKDPTLQASA